MNTMYASGFGDIEFEILKDIASKSGFEKKVRITSDDLDKKVSSLKLGGPDGGSVLPVRIILFETDDNKNVINFINLFKSMQIASAIFAVVTKHNKDWTFRELAGHLLKEHQQMLLKKPSQNNK